MPKTPSRTKVVSVRVPENLPDQVKAATGLSFSGAIVQFFVPFINSLKATESPSHDNTD